MTSFSPVNIQEEKTQAKKEQAELEKRLEKEKQTRERFNRELRDAQSSEYQREINALEDKKQAYIAEGISEVEANKLFAEQKAAIDKKYFDKLQAERQKQVKEAEAAYKKEAEEAKKAREAAISDAAATLKNNIKIARYIQNEQKKGTYSEEKAQQFANNLYLRQNGMRQTDIDFLKNFGKDNLARIADAQSRLFKDFAPPSSTNNVTINFDNTVVEDVSTIDKLANKVAEVITQGIEQKLQGGGQYGYSYR